MVVAAVKLLPFSREEENVRMVVVQRKHFALDPKNSQPDIADSATTRRNQLHVIPKVPQFRAIFAPRNDAWTDLVLRHRSGAVRMAMSMLRKWKCRIEGDELRSLVDLALCEAARRFDPKHGTSFVTYLFYYLRGALVKAVVIRSDSSLLFVEDYERPLPRIQDSLPENDRLPRDWNAPVRLNSSHWAEEPVELDEVVFRKQIVKKFLSVCNRLRGAEGDIMRRLFLEQQEIQQVVDETGYSRGHVFRLRSRALGKVRHAVGRPMKQRAGTKSRTVLKSQSRDRTVSA